MNITNIKRAKPKHVLLFLVHAKTWAWACSQVGLSTSISLCELMCNSLCTFLMKTTPTSYLTCLLFLKMTFDNTFWQWDSTMHMCIEKHKNFLFLFFIWDTHFAWDLYLSLGRWTLVGSHDERELFKGKKRSKWKPNLHETKNWCSPFNSILVFQNIIHLQTT
jgi:hypothetical protein